MLRLSVLSLRQWGCVGRRTTATLLLLLLPTVGRGGRVALRPVVVLIGIALLLLLVLQMVR